VGRHLPQVPARVRQRDSECCTDADHGIVNDPRFAREDEQGERLRSLRGQYVGFCNTLSEWLVASAKQLGRDLDHVSEADLIGKANAGLALDEEAYLEQL